MIRIFRSMVIVFVSVTTLFPIENRYSEKIDQMINLLISAGVDKLWIENRLNSADFIIHDEISNIFQRMAENRVRNNECDFDWYKNHFGLDLKIRYGKTFHNNHRATLELVESKHGIPSELVTAIIGMETNYGQQRFVGNYTVFDALVSQFVLMPERERFALNELRALYEFTRTTGKPVEHFRGSFAGASGLGQFIPSSLLNYFIDINGNNNDIDIYSMDDTIASIDNYLYKHGLNEATINNSSILYNSVFAYNRSDAYVEAVLYIYDGIKN